MKSLEELTLPNTCRYSDDHEWARRINNGIIRAGISDYAQNQLGDIVYVELPPIGAHFTYNELFGTVESVKAVSELLCPVAGEVIAVNDALRDTPEMVNTDPYEGGWMIDIKPDDPASIDNLMDVDAYRIFLKGAH
jgi:glycine cleavage system H protein